MQGISIESRDVAVTLSTNVDESIARKVRTVADKEHRSVSNVVSSAITVFTELPKELRDALLELRSQDSTAFKRLSREMMAAIARLRLDTATERLAADTKSGPREMDELEMLEEATRLTEAVRTSRHP